MGTFCFSRISGKNRMSPFIFPDGGEGGIDSVAARPHPCGAHCVRPDLRCKSVAPGSHPLGFFLQGVFQTADITFFVMAEREGFEPPVPGRGHRISNAARSTTPAPLLDFAKRIVRFFRYKSVLFTAFYSLVWSSYPLLLPTLC